MVRMNYFYMKKLFGLFFKVGTYALCLAASLILAYNLKFAFVVPEDLQKVLWCNVIWLVSVKIIILILLGEFKGIFSYFRLPDLVKAPAGYVPTCEMLDINFKQELTK